MFVYKYTGTIECVKKYPTCQTESANFTGK